MLMVFFYYYENQKFSYIKHIKWQNLCEWGSFLWNMLLIIVKKLIVLTIGRCLYVSFYSLLIRNLHLSIDCVYEHFHIINKYNFKTTILW